MRIADVIRYIAALQEEGCTVESVALHPVDIERLQRELAEDPRSGEAVTNQIALRLFEGRNAAMYLLGCPLFIDDSMDPGSIVMEWFEA
jgi:hypothetical protein